MLGNLWNTLRANQEEYEIEHNVDQLDIANSTDGNEIVAIAETASLQNQVPETTGKIVLENVKVDLRQVLFGALPVVKRVSPSEQEKLGLG